MQSVSLNPRINYSVKCVLRVKNDCLFLSENHVGSQHCVPGAHFSSLEKLQVKVLFFICAVLKFLPLGRNNSVNLVIMVASESVCNHF